MKQEYEMFKSKEAGQSNRNSDINRMIYKEKDPNYTNDDGDEGDSKTTEEKKKEKGMSQADIEISDLIIQDPLPLFSENPRGILLIRMKTAVFQ